MGRVNLDAREALALLAGAADEGLDAGDYHAAALETMRVSLDATEESSASDAEAFNAALTASMLRYFSDLHLGRVDPRQIGFHMTAPSGGHDFASILSEALSAHRITGRAAELAPSLRLYRDLRRMLSRYRALAANPSLGALPRDGRIVHPGDRYDGLRELRGRLEAFGDISATAGVLEGTVYSGAMVDGVKHFQLRHGLAPDGVLGRATQAALDVPLSWRVRQIEIALERLRWLPDLGSERLVAVNIPMFRVWAWDSTQATAEPSFTTGAIVGRALNTQTPVFDEEMRYLIFRPYWNVPRSILRHEVIPALSRDPEYFEKHDLEMVAGAGDRARAVAVTEESLASLRQGSLRVRQRPGPTNSLGLVKFVFPNSANVYLHGTPAAQLFSRSRRDFSHGCVRIEDSVGLAEWALKEQPGWTRERILSVMNANESVRVDIKHPIRVILFYVTAVVMPEDGTIRFAEDIYRHDTALDRALNRRRPAR